MFSLIRNRKLFSKSAVVGLNERNVNLIYPNNNKKHYKLADDKVLSKELLHQHQIPCAKTYAVIEYVSEIKSIWKTCAQYNSLAIKPANGCGGGGIKILRKNAEGQWTSSGKVISDRQIFQHMASTIMGF